MRVLGLVLAGALALMPLQRSRPRHWVRAGIQCPMVGTVTGDEHPTPRINGTADRFRRVGARIVLLVGGVPNRGWASPRTGSGVPRAGPLIIRSQTGAARRAAGVIRNSIPSARFQSALRDFIPRCETSLSSCRVGALLPATRGRFALGDAAFQMSP